MLDPSEMGLNTTDPVLPTGSVDDRTFQAPKYDFSDALPTPAQLGVRRDNSLGSVMQAVRGSAYYLDMIGFGQPMFPGMTGGMGQFPMGINYFVPTPLTCSNGAQMWEYIEGIPKGDAFGARVGQALNEMGFPALKGLAPGILEDSKAALNPTGMVRAAVGNIYPKCRLSGKVRVGDAKNDASMIQGAKDFVRGVPTQEKWVLDSYIDQAVYDKTPKTHNMDGSPKKQGFCTEDKASLATAVLLGLAAFYVRTRK